MGQEKARIPSSSIKSAQAAYARAASDFERAEKLLAGQNIAAAEYDQIRQERNRTQAELRTAEEELRIGETGAREEDIRAKEAEIKEIGIEASPTTRTYPVTLIMDNPDGLILPGMAGDLQGRGEVSEDMEEKGYEVPEAAVFMDEQGNRCVWIIDETSMTVKRRKVTLGEPSPRGLRVKGVNQGQMIATAGVESATADQEDGRQLRCTAGPLVSGLPGEHRTRHEASLRRLPGRAVPGEGHRPFRGCARFSWRRGLRWGLNDGEIVSLIVSLRTCKPLSTL